MVPEDGLAVRDGRQGGEPAKSIGPGLRRILNMMVVLRTMMKTMAMTRKDYPPSSFIQSFRRLPVSSRKKRMRITGEEKI